MIFFLYTASLSSLISFRQHLPRHPHTFPMLVTVLPDENWIDKMPKGRPPDADFHRRLRAAADDPALSDSRENTHKALYRLAEHGVVALDYSSSSSPLAPLAQYICSTLLNFALHTNTHNSVFFQLSLDPVQSTGTFPIPVRSKLILWHLAHSEDFNIFLFSSRDRPVVFDKGSSNHTVALFHRVDSFRNVSEYLVLVPSSHFVPTTITRPPAQRLPPPASQVPLASFRTLKRSRAVHEREDLSEVTEDACMRAFKRAW